MNIENKTVLYQDSCTQSKAFNVHPFTNMYQDSCIKFESFDAHPFKSLYLFLTGCLKRYLESKLNDQIKKGENSFHFLYKALCLFLMRLFHWWNPRFIERSSQQCLPLVHWQLESNICGFYIGPHWFVVLFPLSLSLSHKRISWQLLAGKSK